VLEQRAGLHFLIKKEFAHCPHTGVLEQRAGLHFLILKK
jgi:hypothetical protein